MVSRKQMDSLEKFKKEINYCTFCPKMCRFACPVAEALNSETFIPTNKFTLLYLWQNKMIEESEELLKIIYQGCTTCLNCQTYCKHKINFPEVIESAKILFKEKGIILEQTKELNKNLKNFSSPYPEPLLEKLKDIIPEKYFKKEAEILYFPGCTSIYYDLQIIKDVIKIFEQIKINFSIYSENVCCGLPYLNLGELNNFKKIAQENIKILNKYKKVISNCPECINTFNKKYLKYGFKLKSEFLPITEFLQDFLTTEYFSNPKKIKEKIIYHDPCYLGRYLQVYSAPRNIISRFCQSELKEFSWNKEESLCCGFGGGLNFIFPEISQKIAQNRLQEFLESDAEILITSCPSCKQMLEKVNKNIIVKDIINLISESI